MALTEIEYGALASSDIMNNNFRFLENQITNLNEIVVTNNAGVNSNIASINSSITAMQDNINADIQEASDAIMEHFSTNGIYVTTYTNGSSWYREYFSDINKQMRVWLEQGGYSSAFENDARYGNVTLIKSFSDTNYTAIITGISSIMSNDHTSWIYTKYNYGFRFCNAYAGVPINWYACGK